MFVSVSLCFLLCQSLQQLPVENPVAHECKDHISVLSFWAYARFGDYFFHLNMWVIEGYEIACKKTLEILPDCACASAKNLRNTEEAASYIRTAVMSKQYGNEDFLSHLIAQACVSVYPESGHFNVDSVRVCKILGSGISSSSVLHGMVFKRETEGDVTSVKNAKIAIFSCPFDCMVTETKGTVLINNAEELLSYSKGEENMMESQVKAIADAGANVVVTGGKVADMALHYANKYQLMVIRLNSKWDLRRLCKTVGASALPRLTPPTPEEMGYCDSVYLTEVGDTQVVVFKHDTQDCKISTLVIRGSTDNLMDDIERAVDDGVNTFKVLVRVRKMIFFLGILILVFFCFFLNLNKASVTTLHTHSFLLGCTIKSCRGPGMLASCLICRAALLIIIKQVFLLGCHYFKKKSNVTFNMLPYCSST
uniref:Chaperonin containing TCP1, subunit 8 (theta) n=1 Tax=Erpetoichthys calabaricus TaxID=27687 RepID=A0A8C4XHI9_ERPCA